MNNEAGKKEKLIRAAMELFAEYGYDKVSIRQLAAAAGVNSSMISYYFNGKSGLYEAVIKEFLQNFEGFIGTLRSNDIDPREGLKMYVQTISGVFYKYPPSFVKLVYREVLNPSEIFEKITVANFKKNVGELLKLIERGKQLGMFRKDLDNEKILLMLISVINFYFLCRPLHTRIIEQDEKFTSDYLQQVMSVFLQGIEVNGDEKA